MIRSILRATSHTTLKIITTIILRITTTKRIHTINPITQVKTTNIQVMDITITTPKDMDMEVITTTTKISTLIYTKRLTLTKYMREIKNLAQTATRQKAM